MPTPTYLKLIGERQGLISSGASSLESVGTQWQYGFQDQILVQSMSYGLSSCKGEQGSLRTHRPLIINKCIDKSSPLLFNAACTGERLKTCELALYRVSSNSGLEHFYTIILEDAVIVDLDLVVPHCQDPAAARYSQLERVQFSFRDITVRHEACGTIGSDTWGGEC